MPSGTSAGGGRIRRRRPGARGRTRGRDRRTVQHRQRPTAFGEPARRPLTRPDVEQGRVLDPAPVEGIWTTRMEPAARRNVDGVRGLADEDGALRTLAG